MARSSAETWQLNHSRKHLSDWVIEFIADTAQDLGMNMHYAWQFLALDDQNNLLFPFDGQVYVDMSLLKKIMNAHEEHILWEADRLTAIRCSIYVSRLECYVGMFLWTRK